MKILSYNIHKGFSFGNRRFTLSRMREVLETVDADLVLLQEVIGEHTGHARDVEDWPEESQFEFLADRLWPHHAYGKNAVYDAGHHGNAILSKHSLVAWENIDVSTNPVEQRGLLHAEIHPPGLGKPLHVICIHFDVHEYGRKKQVRMLAERIASRVPDDCPLIVAGDFNDWKERAGHVLESELSLVEAYKSLHGSCARSFPCRFPLLRLDRIYIRGLVPIAAECKSGKPWSDLSDHAALYAELAPAATPTIA
jgi:endonuclease/exonuclease/phosphatase family metal-dependent hydrolase